MITFQQEVDSWELRYFTAEELLYKGPSNATHKNNTDPPLDLWRNIKDAALTADEARHRLGSSVAIVSAFRSPAYNKAIKGAANSLHKQFRALDLKPLKATPKALHAILHQLRKDGFPGARGIGIYPTFCHTDNGTPRDW